MTVNFIVPFQLVADNFKLYELIILAIHSAGHSLSRNWIEPAFYGAQHMLQEDEYDNEGKLGHIIASIKDSDLVIVDASAHGTFGTGYLTAKALEWGKPTLILHRKGTVRDLLSRLLSEIIYIEFSTADEAVDAIKKFLNRSVQC